MSMTVSRLKTGYAARTCSMMLIAALAMAAQVAAAHPDATPHPARVSSGACDSVGDIVAPLSDVAPRPGDAAVGSPAAIPVEMSVTQIDVPLEQIVDGGHVIDVRKSADGIDQTLACGPVGGTIGENGLSLGLGEIDDSGYTGVALLQAVDNKTDVTIYLVQGISPNTAGDAQDVTPAATRNETINIKNFAYDPPAIDVPVGGSVTWTNDDNAPHTATATNGTIPDSGAIPFGTSFTQVFDTPGTYDYFCVYHPNMKASIVVK
jgi:plastocyanin